MKTSLKKTLAVLAAAALAPQFSNAQLLVTEINSNASGGDFWELTNFGLSPVNLFNGATPWSWDDDSDTPGASLLPLGISIASGESIIILPDTTDVAGFRNVWGLDLSVQVLSVSVQIGLGQNDRVTLFDDANNPVVSLNYAAGGFTRSSGDASTGGHAGVSAGGLNTQSAIWDPNFGNTPGTARYTVATNAVFGSFAAPNGNGYGSPGLVPEPTTTALAGLGLAAVLIFRRRNH
ncbi:MAG TPA: PEP-CTERM sorting domain-containing protein [Verrucomicrobiota bacterium]|nr:PEP-CTERM sorting domain-containing protein [Verrucomicrobiota bacterium]